jgi:hypothetical protein
MSGFFESAGDSAGRAANLGLGIGFFVGCIAVIGDQRFRGWMALITIGGVAAFFAGAGAAMAVVAHGILGH